MSAIIITPEINRKSKYKRNSVDLSPMFLSDNVSRENNKLNSNG